MVVLVFIHIIYSRRIVSDVPQGAIIISYCIATYTIPCCANRRMNKSSQRSPSSADQSALSLLVNAAEGSREASARQQQENQQLQQQQQQQQSFANQLRQGIGREGGGGLSLEEQFLLQQQLQGASFGGGGSMGLLGQLRDQNLMSQYGQQQQLAMLLGLGGGGQGLAAGHQSDVHAALAAQLRQQQQQQQQFTQADLLALSRSGGLGGLSGMLGGGAGGMGAGGASSFANELEGLQRLEELERRQRLLAAASGGGMLQGQGIGAGGDGSPSLVAKMHHEDSRLPVPSHSSSGHMRNRKKHSADAHTGSKLASPMKVRTVDDNKDELEKAPGSVIVPCRARGMPMDHNFKTAYFVIPENVKHGEELICSYFACRNAGIKFRYCSHCKVPVAKRNFRKRHKHGGEEIAKLPGEESEGEEEMVAVKKGIPSQITAGNEEVEADGISSQSTDSNEEKATGLARSAVRTFDNSTKQAAAAAVLPPSLTKAVIGYKTSGAEREKRWLSLLTKRPATKDGDAMSGWLMEVLAISDLETPLKQNGGEVIVSGGGPAGGADSESNDGNGVVVVTDETQDAKPPAVEKKDEAGSPSDTESVPSSDESTEKKRQAPVVDAEIVKKKRPVDETVDESVGTNGESNHVSGSFAAWKERKKQKKQAKATDSNSREP